MIQYFHMSTFCIFVYNFHKKIEKLYNNFLYFIFIKLIINDNLVSYLLNKTMIKNCKK